MNILDNAISLLENNGIDTNVNRVVVYVKDNMLDSEDNKIPKLTSYRENAYYEVFFSNGLYMCLGDYMNFSSDNCNIASLDRIEDDIKNMFREVSFENVVNSSFVNKEIVEKFCN